MKCSEIVLLNYPFTDNTGTKVHPALVVSGDRYNQGDDVVFVPISSAPSPTDPYAFTVRDTDPHFQQTGLRQTSNVKWSKPMTLSRRVIPRRLGTLAPQPLCEVRSKVQQLFQP